MREQSGCTFLHECTGSGDLGVNLALQTLHGFKLGAMPLNGGCYFAANALHFIKRNAIATDSVVVRRDLSVMNEVHNAGATQAYTFREGVDGQVILAI